MELHMERWPGGAVAVVIAAAVTGVSGVIVALATGISAAVRSLSDDRQRRRLQRWERLAWSLEMAAIDERRRAEIGLACARAMYDMPGITVHEREIVRNVLELTDLRRAERGEAEHDEHTQD